jgi:hypothetical protein
LLSGNHRNLAVVILYLHPLPTVKMRHKLLNPDGKAVWLKAIALSR